MNHDLEDRLRAAAGPVPRGRVHAPAAQDLLDRIVATPLHAEPAPRPALRRTRWVLAGAVAAAALTAATLVVPGLGGEREAYASWTPTPAPLPAADTAALARDCLDQKLAADYGYRQSDLDRARKVLGERRGAYDYVAIATQRWSATCFRDEAGTVHWGSVMEQPVSDAQLGRAGVEMQAWGQLRTSEGYVRLMSGHLGTDVAGVDIAIPGGRTVRATVQDRYFLAWYPEAVDEQGPTTLTLRLTDGRTVGGLSARDLHDAPKLD